jgi:hypothetical protein
MSHIFIAHVEEDAEIALKIALSLEEAGYKTWFYEIDSVPGPSYIVRTGESVAQSQAVVVIISPHSLGSSQVTKEVVRAHESDKRFIPILKDITHSEFQQRQPEWREAIGSATSIRIPPDGIEAAMPLIIEGVRLLGIKPEEQVDAKRIARITKAIEDIHSLPASWEKKPAPQPAQAVIKSRKPLFIVIISVIVIAIAITSIFLAQGGNKDRDRGTTSNLTTTKPVTTDIAPPFTTPATTVPGTTALTSLATPYPTTTATSTTPPVTDLKPDIVVQEISWSPKDPYLGYDTTFTMAITNRGKDKAGTSHVAYYIDGIFQDSISVGTIDAGATLKASFHWKTEQINLTIKAIADFNNSVDESDETNNTKEIIVEVLYADLIISDIAWSPTNPIVGDLITFTATVKNQAVGACGQFYVGYYRDGDYSLEYSIDKLYGGQTATVVFTGTARSGMHIYKIVADYLINHVKESDETNNSKTVTITIP